MATILIAGGTGLIGTRLQQILSSYYTVKVLSRNKSICNNSTLFYWNPNNLEISSLAFENVTCVINLSGENISNKRWSHFQKEKIQKSRILSTQTLAQGIQKYGTSVTTYISSSAIGYYGCKSNKEMFEENNVPGNDFLAETCKIWEEEAMRIENLGAKTIIIRTGIVISKHGGMLHKILKLLPFRMIPVFGKGTNIIPWIHIDDMCAIYKFAIDNTSLQGIYNAVSNNCSQLEFMQTIQHVYKKKNIIFRIPTLLMKSILGEMATILITGNAISNSKIIEAGFSFIYTNTIKALEKEICN